MIISKRSETMLNKKKFKQELCQFHHHDICRYQEVIIVIKTQIVSKYFTVLTYLTHRVRILYIIILEK